VENRPGRKFCSECGAPLVFGCPACGAANDPADRFCGDCGARLTAEDPPAPPTPAPPESERRLVSVLFADLVGFTTLSESRDAEEVRELLSRYFDTARRIIARYGGTVEKFIGDAVMAIWGAPVAREDDAERAVRAALELVDAVRALGEDAGAELAVRAGVTSGEAAVTVGAEGEGMVAGDLVNTASRVQTAARPGSVYVGEATRRMSEAAIVYEEAGEHALKGKTEPVRLWRALRVVAAAGGAQRSSALEPPFVGRDRELRMVKELFHASAEDGRAQLVSVVGGAGIGKSRLGWEFFKYLDGLAIDTRWHRGRCLAYGEGVTYWALAEMVRTNASILEGEGPETALPKLHDAVETALPDAEERRWVEPRLASLLGLESGPARDREDLFAAWRLFYERLAEVMPTVMVFEDIHWADASLLDFVEYLLEWSRSYPLFILTLGRPDLLERRPDWGSGRRASTSIYLEPLTGESMSTLLEGLGLPDPLAGRVRDRAEGVPLYAVETVRMLVDRGVLTPGRAGYRATGSVEELDVPETLHGLIAARLDGLTADERRLVQDAAVLGKTFTKQALGAVAALDAEPLDALVGSLVRKEILTVQADPLSPERGQYAFLGDLVRFVAYETLSKKERKARHLAVASYLESAFEEEDVVEVVASHYLQAYEAAPDAADAPEIRARASDTLARAGERAAALAASGEAKRYFEQAADLTREPATRAGLRARAGDMAWHSGDTEGAKACYDDAIALFEAEGDSHAAARVSASYAEVIWYQELGRFLYFAGRPDAAAARLEEALELAEGLHLPAVFSEALNSKSLALSFHGRFEEATLLLRHALEVALEHDLGAAGLRAYNNLCASYGVMNRHEDELRTAAQGLEFARRLGDRTWELQLLACHVNPLVMLGRWDEALERVAEIGADAETGAAMLATELTAILPVYMERGEREQLERFVELLPEQDAEAPDVTRLAARARALRRRGEHAEALRLIDGMGADTVELSEKVEVLVEALENAAALGDPERLRTLLEDASRWRPGERTPYVRAQLTRFGAREAVWRGDAPSAENGFKQASGAFRELRMPFWTAVAELEYAEWLIVSDRVVEAAPRLADARPTFERLKARPWLERLDALQPQPETVAG
jgi:class 3 adenylate cyclase/tetratricopeptide (TPR) repeat protein